MKQYNVWTYIERDDTAVLDIKQSKYTYSYKEDTMRCDNVIVKCADTVRQELLRLKEVATKPKRPKSCWTCKYSEFGKKIMCTKLLVDVYDFDKEIHYDCCIDWRD